MTDINTFVLTGVVQNCQQDTSQSGTYYGTVFLTVVKAVGTAKPRKEEVMVVPVKFFGDRKHHFPIGQHVIVQGRAGGREWNDKYYPELVLVEAVSFDAATSTPANPPAPPPPPPPDDFDDRDNDLPF